MTTSHTHDDPSGCQFNVYAELGVPHFEPDTSNAPSFDATLSLVKCASVELEQDETSCLRIVRHSNSYVERPSLEMNASLADHPSSAIKR
jgi:hypothetical protein